jgi:hypothetical protein
MVAKLDDGFSPESWTWSGRVLFCLLFELKRKKKALDTELNSMPKVSRWQPCADTASLLGSVSACFPPASLYSLFLGSLKFLDTSIRIIVPLN